MKRLSTGYSCFSLIELLVVITIIGIISSLLMNTVVKALDSSKLSSCQNNQRQIGIGLTVYYDQWNNMGPYANGTCYWNLHPFGWMEQLSTNISENRIYSCPSADWTDFAYFLGTRAAYIANGNKFRSITRSSIQYPSCHVALGDSSLNMFDPRDCDKDDYTQNALSHGPYSHTTSFNVLFSDNHASNYTQFEPQKMTFRYDSMHEW